MDALSIFSSPNSVLRLVGSVQKLERPDKIELARSTPLRPPPFHRTHSVTPRFPERQGGQFSTQQIT